MATLDATVIESSVMVRNPVTRQAYSTASSEPAALLRTGAPVSLLSYQTISLAMSSSRYASMSPRTAIVSESGVLLGALGRVTRAAHTGALAP